MLIKITCFFEPQEVEINIEPTDKVERMKELAAEKVDFPVEDILLIWSHKYMEDGKTAKYYKLQEGSKVHLVLRQFENSFIYKEAPTKAPTKKYTKGRAKGPRSEYNLRSKASKRVTSQK